MNKKDKKQDLTRIEDLSEYLHPEDSSEVDTLLSEDVDSDDEPLPPPFEFSNTDESELVHEENIQENDDTKQDFFDNGDNEFDSSFTDSNSDEIEKEDEDINNEFNSEFPETETESFEIDFENDSTFLENQDVEEIEIIPVQKDYSNESNTYPSPPRENFKDVKEFAKNVTYGEVQNGGNPAFSIILKNIDSKDSNESILNTLREHNLLGENEKIYRQSLELGTLLIAQISEYSAIYLATKLRKYSHDIQVGLSEDIHPSKSYKSDNKGLTTKRSIFQNKDKAYKKSQSKFEIEDMIITKQSQVVNSNIIEHLGVVSISDTFALSRLSNNNEAETINLQNSSEIYEMLTHKLTCLAFEKGANALLSVSHSLTPLRQQNDDDEILYQVICTADAAIIEKS